VRKIHRCAISHIPFKAEPVLPFDPALPVSEKQGMHLPGKQVRQAENLALNNILTYKTFVLDSFYTGYMAEVAENSNCI